MGNLKKSTQLLIDMNTCSFNGVFFFLLCDRVRDVGEKKCQDIEHRYEEEKKSVKKQYSSNMDVSFTTSLQC
jgi:hypothetical protein